VPRRESLSPAQARRVLLAAQGFGPRPAREVRARQLAALAQRLSALQIDSVNVLSRAHYLPGFSRLGSYRRDALDRLSSHPPVRLFEYWGHEASLLPVQLHPLLRWRMARDHAWSGVAAAAADNPGRVAQVLRVLRDDGPLTGQQLENALESRAVRSKDRWGWNWSLTKHIVEHLFWTGEVTTVGRDPGFRRRYDLVERVLPAAVLNQPTPAPADARAGLAEAAARALGVFTASDIADYFRLRPADARAAVARLQEEGRIAPVAVPGWPQAWIHHRATVPRSVSSRALLVPFDPLIWLRERVQRAFGMRYRIEIYVPAARREFGYYVLPFLLGDQLVARVDLKADRAAGRLLVQSSWLEPGNSEGGVAQPLVASLGELASWLGLAGVCVKPTGTLAAALAEGIRRTGGRPPPTF
jgi:hypothetical protein